jgi:hypothetical protein
VKAAKLDLIGMEKIGGVRHGDRARGRSGMPRGG